MSLNRKAYPSDVSDDEWALVAPHLTLVRKDAGQRAHPLREVFNGLRYVVKTGALSRWMPNDLPPWAAVYQQAQRWNAEGCFEQLVEDLRAVLRFAAGHKADRLENLLRAATERSDANRKAGEAELIRLRRRRSEAEAGLTRHYEAIEKGVASLDEPVPKQRIEELRLQASEARTRIATLEARRSVDPVALTPEVVLRAPTEIGKRLREGSPEWRKTWLRHFVDEVAIHPDRIVIRRPKSALVETLNCQPADATTVVPSFDRKWRARKDSNL